MGQSRTSSLRAVGKPERLLRASVSAFCAISRPTKRETAQLDDLAVPLLGCVSDECLRFVAAALSETPFAPPVLVRRLADQPIEISAPLLMRSPVLTAIDLVALIGRHGVAHARAIAARSDLDARILRLIRSIGALEQARPTAEPVRDAVEETREHLRAMMRPAAATPARPPVELPRWQDQPDAYRKLRSTALSGVPALFHTALADALGIAVEEAAAVADDSDVHALLVALKSLELTEEQAFLIVQCIWPGRQRDHARAVGSFIDAYSAITGEEVDEKAPAYDAPANEPGRQDSLKAS